MRRNKLQYLSLVCFFQASIITGSKARSLPNEMPTLMCSPRVVSYWKQGLEKALKVPKRPSKLATPSLNIIGAQFYTIPLYNSANFDCIFLILANGFLGVGMPCGSLVTFPGKEGGIQVWTGLAQSSQTVGF
jgi:hypothetical protein